MSFSFVSKLPSTKIEWNLYDRLKLITLWFLIVEETNEDQFAGDGRTGEGQLWEQGTCADAFCTLTTDPRVNDVATAHISLTRHYLFSGF